MTIDLFNYHRRHTTVVNVGNTPLGGEYPIRVQSMTTTPTLDTKASVEQAERIAEAGGEYVRLTTQGTREAENLRHIHDQLRKEGFTTPLVADVHFNPHVADVAAHYAEKVRINPGNYVDPARSFRHLEYTEEEYQEELRKIEQRFLPFLQICRENHTAIRIGVNHGSLSDRIMSRYGDTPEGIVESCMEFLRICKRENFNDVVISIKASNTVVMVLSVRRLVEEMERNNMHYPLHLGVTEAGEGEDGRIKSAVGIGALLADGIGDTIRVSLSEEPEAEIPVARKLTEYITQRENHPYISGVVYRDFNYLHPTRRETREIAGIGGKQAPVVIIMGADNNEFHEGRQPDFIYTGLHLPENRKSGQRFLLDFMGYFGEPDTYPFFSFDCRHIMDLVNAPVKFLHIPCGTPTGEYADILKRHPETVVIAVSQGVNRPGEMRAFIHEMMVLHLDNPVIGCLCYNNNPENKEDIQLESAADYGPLLIDQLLDGMWLVNSGTQLPSFYADTAFGILQAARLRMSKTEYISCPGCGRTLYDLRTTIARIKTATQHLKGLKIGIMGCIVNGPGEMADADYGYVGAGRGKISLYKGKTCVEKNIPEEEAVEKLLELIGKDMQP